MAGRYAYFLHLMATAGNCKRKAEKNNMDSLFLSRQMP
jgi:hypothetical protein